MILNLSMPGHDLTIIFFFCILTRFYGFMHRHLESSLLYLFPNMLWLCKSIDAFVSTLSLPFIILIARKVKKKKAKQTKTKTKQNTTSPLTA